MAAVSAARWKNLFIVLMVPGGGCLSASVTKIDPDHAYATRHAECACAWGPGVASSSPVTPKASVLGGEIPNEPDKMGKIQ